MEERSEESKSVDSNEEEVTENKKKRRISWASNTVDDEDAPEYYSLRAIWRFSILGNVLIGAGMLAFNVDDNAKRTIIMTTMIIYAIIEFLLVDSFLTAGAYMSLNFVGALLMRYFWKEYLGYEVRYRKKSIMIPLGVWLLLIWIVMLYLVFTVPDGY